MADTGFLTWLLVIAGVVIVVLWNRANQLSRDINGAAVKLFDQWKQRDYSTLRQQEGERANRDARTQLQQWKLDAERSIRQDAITRSQAVTIGKVTEHIAPYLPDFSFNPKDARFIGTPVDFIVFDGLADGAVSQVVFIEVKSSRSNLTAKERQVRDAVITGRVQWQELRVAVENLS